MRILYQIRCNLFHGDKSELEDPRNLKLVGLGDEILRAILTELV